MAKTPVICFAALFLSAVVHPQAAQPQSTQPQSNQVQPNLPLRVDRTAAIAAADVDDDGDVDLFFANSTMQPNVLLLGDGEGAFVDASADHLPEEAASTIGAVFGDVDGDGDQDLICANFNVGSRLYLNDGTGRFGLSPAMNWPQSAGGDYSLAVFDVDRDGDLDVVFGSSDRPPGQDPKEPWLGMRLYQNDGKGRFVDKTDAKLGVLSRAVSISIGDIDGDGDLDMVCGSGNTSRGGAPKFYRNDGTGSFADVTAKALDVEGRGTQCVYLVDLDRDGDLDLVAGPGLSFREPCRMYLNDGNGIFAEGGKDFGRRQRGAIAIHAADLRGDGGLDLILGRFALRQYLRQKDGRYIERKDWLEDDLLAATFLCVDVNGDGALDLVGGGRGQNWLRFNNGKGIFRRSLLPATRKR